MENSQQIKNELSNADKKRLYILEKLKEEWDLNHNEIRIPARMFSSWWRECGIDNYSQFNSILNTFKDEGLLSIFNTIDPDSSK